MDMWLFYEATHWRHRYLNPISEPGVRDLEQILDLKPGARVLDIACGHAQMLIDMVERYGIRGVGVDLSPYHSKRAIENVRENVPEADLEIVVGRGEEYESDRPFDVAMCIGASWIWQGYAGTLKALTGFVKPGGLVVAGEPYWRMAPPSGYVEAEDFAAEDFTTLAAYDEFARELGLRPLWMRGASEQEWDAYEMTQLASFDAWARENPDHPERAEIEAKLRANKSSYLRWGRDYLGFAIWVFRTPE